MERKRTTQRLASIGVRQVVSHFNYEICELRRRPVESRCIEFIIRPNFLTSNSRYLKGKRNSKIKPIVSIDHFFL
ncbi:hypothetical protein [Leptospira noguchii]|uniref:hypothetical protein n=1 Tax=Leptospira noguchii TaxID=28182 RepID=UPI0009E49664|nr:hypothetical protein [Leptospira noguchii]